MTAVANQAQKQSRVGKQPIAIPKGVEIRVDGLSVSLKGPKGEITTRVGEGVVVEQKDGQLVIGLDDKAGRNGPQFQGLARALLNNGVVGVSTGYKLALDLHGVGYRAEVKGTQLNLSLGLSHPVHYELPDGVSAKVEIIDEGGNKRPRVHLESHDKSLIGRVGSRIRSFRPPEPYKGKGVRYLGERIREKAGKAGAKS